MLIVSTLSSSKEMDSTLFPPQSLIFHPPLVLKYQQGTKLCYEINHLTLMSDQNRIAPNKYQYNFKQASDENEGRY